LIWTKNSERIKLGGRNEKKEKPQLGHMFCKGNSRSTRENSGSNYGKMSLYGKTGLELQWVQR